MFLPAGQRTSPNAHSQKYEAAAIHFEFDVCSPIRQQPDSKWAVKWAVAVAGVVFPLFSCLDLVQDLYFDQE